MFNVLSELSWLAVIAATAALVVTGGLWFTVIFGKA